MRVLLTNHHLHDRAGSELYVSELASALRERGHDARIFTLLPGEQAERLKGAGFAVYTPTDFADVEAFNPEVAHVHHGPCLWWVGSINLSCPVIFSSLGVIPPHEAAPAAWPGVALGVAVSEEVLARLSATPFGKSVPLHVMRNWFDDRGKTPAGARAPKTDKRVAVVSNHLHPHVAQTLTAAGVEWTHLGLPDNSVELTPELLAPFDVVVSIGRTVLLAAALGKPVIVWDAHGSDGVLHAARIDELAAVNFSGRASGLQPSLDALRAMLDDCTTVDVAAVQRVMRARFTLTARAAEWEALYQRAIDSGTRLTPEARDAYQPTFDVYWNELTARREHTDALRAQLAAAEARAHATDDQLRQSRTDARLLREEVEVLRAELDAGRAQLKAPGATDALRFAEKANALRISLLPEGTKRLAAFRTALHWARKKSR